MPSSVSPYAILKGTSLLCDAAFSSSTCAAAVRDGQETSGVRKGGQPRHVLHSRPLSERAWEQRRLMPWQYGS